MQTNRLREYRERAVPPLSRNKLAARVGIDGQTIYRIENGAGTTIATANALARALSDALGEEIPVGDLFPHEEEVSA